MSRTKTSSSCSPSSWKILRCCFGSDFNPEKISAYMRATRFGVSCRPSRSGSSPTASRISRTAFSIRSRSINEHPFPHVSRFRHYSTEAEKKKRPAAKFAANRAFFKTDRACCLNIFLPAHAAGIPALSCSKAEIPK